MKTLKQLLRHPGKTLSGFVLLTLATSLLLVCVGQYLSVEYSMDALDERYDTVALAIRTLQNEEKRAEISQWLDRIVQDYPEIVKLDSRPGLASAYIPELDPDLSVLHEDVRNIGVLSDAIHVGSDVPYPVDSPYCGGIFAVTILRAEQTEGFGGTYDNGESFYVPTYTTLYCSVDEVLALTPGYNDPTGFTATITLEDQTLEQAESQGYVAGAKLLVYSRGYFDWDYVGRETLRDQYPEKTPISVTDPECIIWLPDIPKMHLFGPQRPITGRVMRSCPFGSSPPIIC